ncbi:unnamed protein product [Cyprideis torosa]|uniref:Uncharacterized protein n=1 Tax=Cyprideis torosa TaxID=163714 RepID=A0A7R8WW27_9CRUS|nr:unnamed protein product [Cyprideis torosa]CAG0907034.1 unnamed protein product [Cyprideis torosa]
MKSVFALLVLVALATAQEAPTFRQLCEIMLQQRGGCPVEGMETLCKEAATTGFWMGSEECLKNMDVEVNTSTIKLAIACCCCNEPEMVRYDAVPLRFD